MQPDEQLSPHFHLSEFTVSETATRLGLRNEPLGPQVSNLRRLAGVLEDVRRALGDVAITVTSGYRAPLVNAAVGSEPTSAHPDGRAADFIAPRFGTPVFIARRLIDAGIVFDQLIDEGGWVHLGIAPLGCTPRQQVLTAVFRRGEKTHYVSGLLRG